MFRNSIPKHLAGLVLAAAATPAMAQSINVDFGDDAGSPDAKYGAAGQSGVWNTVIAGPGVPAALVNLDGRAIDATVTIDQPLLGLPDAATSGNDEQLLEDGVIGLGDVARTISFDGLANGTYALFVYGWTPGQPDATTLVYVNDDVNNIQVLGGAWPGGFELGVTHAVFEVDVTDQTLDVGFAGSIVGSEGFVNAVQLTYLDDPDASPADFNGDGVVDVLDLLILLEAWSDGHGCDGFEVGCPVDLNGDESIGIEDLLLLLAEWT